MIPHSGPAAGLALGSLPPIPRWQPGPLRRLLRRRAVYWALAALLVVLTAVVVRHITAQAEAARAGWGTSTTVLVVTHPVGAGEALAGRVEARAVPLSLVPAGAARALPEGVTAGAPLGAGEILVTARLRGPGLGGVVGSGQLAFAFPAGPHLPPAEVGMPVAVLALADPLVGGAALTVPGTVVDVDDERVTVAVPLADAAEVAAALSRGTAALALAP